MADELTKSPTLIQSLDDYGYGYGYDYGYGCGG